MFIITKTIGHLRVFLRGDLSITGELGKAKKFNNSEEAEKFLQSSSWQTLSPNKWKIAKLV